MTDPLPVFYSNPGNNDRRTKWLGSPVLRNSFQLEPRMRSCTMSTQNVRETLLPVGAFACSVTFVLAVVFFS